MDIPRSEARQTWYVTFGASHVLAKYFIQFDDATEDEVRATMFRDFGKKWGFTYTDTGWYDMGVSQQERYSLHKIEGKAHE